jgi:hypothetical protein
MHSWCGCADISLFKPAGISNPDPLNFIKRHFESAAVIELRGSCAGMVCHLCGLIERAVFSR